MENVSIAQQIEEMIRSRAASGPGMIRNYASSLDAAAKQDQQSIDSLRGIYSDPSKFEKPVLGALGLGLMKGTKSGSFNEGMYNALSAATEAKDYNREQNLSREEKLAKLSALQAQLTRQQANDQMGVYDKQTSYMTSAQADQNTLADLELANRPAGPRQLAPGEFGPQAPGSTPFEKSMKIYNDYLDNPNAFAGPQGQAMVRSALDVIKNERTNARFESIAQSRASRRPTLGSRDKAIMDDAVTQNNTLEQTLLNLEEAEKLGPDTWYGPFANTRARATSWWYGEDGQDDTTADEHLRYQQIMEGEAIKQMSEVLKGATTDREMQKFIDIIADPSVPWDATKKEALRQVKRFARSVIDMNNEKIRGIRDGSYWTGEAGGSDYSSSPFEQMDPGAVLGEDADGNVITVDDILTTARENNMTPEEVIDRLRSGQ